MIKKLILPIYHGRLVIVQKKDITEAPEKYKPNGFDIKGYCGITCYRDNKHGVREYIILVHNPTNIKTIAHEAVHCANYIFQHLQVDYDKNNDEHFAYLVEWIVGQCVKYLKTCK